MKQKKIKTYKGFVIVLFTLGFLISLISAYDSNNSSIVPNESCTGDLCKLDSGGYTYQENLNDPKCYYNLNFCNLDFDPRLNMSENAVNLMNTLKQVNYQMQDELQVCKDNTGLSKTASYILIAVAVIAGLWALYLTITNRRSK